MISYYKTIEDKIKKIDIYEPGCWVNCIDPSEDEANYLISEFNIEPEFIRSSLDKEESSHIDKEDGTTLVIVDAPVVEKHGKNITYLTMPISIMITDQNVITVSLRDNPVLNEFSDGALKNVYTHFKTHFVLHILLRMATKYLQYLNQIDKISDHVEKELRKSMKNKQLIQLLEIEKSLVYFSSSLKSNIATIEKISRGKHLKLYEEDQDLLEDVLIEIRQAMEMATIYLNIISGTMDAFSSIISNNLNVVMKVLASITLIISIPTVISGLYGMNMDYLPMTQHWWFPFILSAVLMVLAGFILKKKDML